MKTYLLKRLLLLPITLLGITFVTFLIIRSAPGDPAAMKLGSGSSETMKDNLINQEVYDKLVKDFGLNDPWYVSYPRWLGRLAHLDFGISIKDKRDVIEKVMERLPITLELNLLAIILEFLIALPLGILCATRQRTFVDNALTVVLFILYSLPSFWVGAILMLYFCGGDYWHGFPVAGLSSDQAELIRLAGLPGTAAFADVSLWVRLKDHLWHLILPATVLTYASFAYMSRQMRSAMLETIRQDYIRTARAKGVAEFWVIYKHALRNSMIPIVTLMASLLPALLGGSIIVETIFSIQGMGMLGFEAVLSRDYNTVMALATVSSLLVLIGILVSDLMYAWVNPTITLS